VATSTSIDLTPPFVEFTVLADEPHVVLIPVTNGDVEVDLAADYPQLTSRIMIGTAVTEDLVGVQDTNVAVITFPALQRGVKVRWELRDQAADQTWLTGQINIAKDNIPQ
jgi:hypothetical protein